MNTVVKNKDPSSFDFIGNIIIVKFPKNFPVAKKKKFAQKLLKENKSVKTILEKIGKVKGRLRKAETKYLLGEKTKEVLYKENNCVFRFNVDTTYFSPRLSNERKEIAQKIKKGENVLVMFSGVCPYGIVIAKNSKAKKVYSIEINRQANKYAKLNISLNKVKDKVILIQGGVKKKIKELIKKKIKFDIIVMPRPQLKESFLKEAFAVSKTGKKGTRVFYYDFCGVNEINKVTEEIKNEAKKAKKKIKILKIKKAGEIAPYKIRVRVDFKII